MEKSLGAFISIIKKLGIVMLIYSMCRILFYLFNLDYFDEGGQLLAFLGGIRFDLSAVIYINLVFILLSLLPIPFRENRGYQKVLNVLFIITNLLGILFNCIDIEYFKFTLKRSTFDLFTLMNTGDDMGQLLPQFIKDYWYLFIVFLAFAYLLLWLNKRIKLPNHAPAWTKKDYLYSSLIFVLAIGLSVLGARGGLQYRPLGLINATLYGSADKIPLVLNTPFSIIRSYGANYIQPAQYFNGEEGKKYFNAQKQYDHNEQIYDNVVILLLESFSYEYLHQTGEHGKRLSPFIDSLSNVSLKFERAYANGKKSVEGVPSVLSSIPSLMTNPFIFSPYSTNKLNGLASILKDEGYSTSFFHGATNGSMGFDSFAKTSGFDQYYGKSEYPYPEHDDGIWGIWDEEFLQYFGQQLNQEKEPFFSLVFTLSSHHPYQVPERYETTFPKAKNPYEHVIQYTDYSLRRFFEEIKDAPWYEHTLFVITADHTSQSSKPYYRNREGLFRIPLFFFHPTKSLMEKSDRVAQHTDILPSVIDFLGVNSKFISFGKSLFSDEDNFSVQYLNNIYQAENEQYHLEFDGDNTIAIFDIRKDSTLSNNLIQALDKKEWQGLENQLKATLQEFNQRMINNQLTAE